MSRSGERLRVFLSGIVALLVFAGASCTTIRERVTDRNEPEKSKPPPATLDTVHLFFGNPSNANQDDPDNYLILGEGSAISYNNSRGAPNWVAWRTVKSDLGPSLPRPDFRPDPRLPEWFVRVGYYDYSGSGYDRGHMVPSADRFGNEVLNEETFYLTNIVPQTPELNQYPWEKLESYVRGQARRGLDAYQIAGVYGTKEILKGKVAVPEGCWKIIAFVAKGRTEITGRTRMIAVDMPNTDGIEKAGWGKFKTSIRAIEEKTGYDFLSDLPRELQDEIERRIELQSP